jgi:hypothetical protein
MDEELTLRYPIGRAAEQAFTGVQPYDERLKTVHLNHIRYLPVLLENAVLNLDALQLATPYRPGGWTIQQLVHHVADSHINAYTRFKLALTENNPVIKPYHEAAWAELSDTFNTPINMSLTLLHALHARWHQLMLDLEEADWGKTMIHPEHNKTISLWNLLATYSWHGRHHVAHVTNLRDRMGWN